jgi:PAS domain S-box-containing protein
MKKFLQWLKGPYIRPPLIYAVAAALWILFSDQLLSLITSDPQELTLYAIYKGWLFVLVTTVLLVLALKGAEDKRFSVEQELRSSEEKFRALAENNPVVITRFDRQFRCLYINLAGVQSFRIPGKSILGKTPHEYLHDSALADLWEQNIRKVIETGEAVQTQYQLSGRIYDWFLSPERGSDGQVEWVIGASLDMSERILAERKFQRKARAYSLLSECNIALVRSSDEPALLNMITSAMVDNGGYRMAWVGYVSGPQLNRIHPASQCGVEDGYLEFLSSEENENAGEREPAFQAVLSRSPVIVNQVSMPDEKSLWRLEAVRCGFRSGIAFPLIHEDKLLGVLEIFAAETEAFPEDEIQLLTELANNLSFGIQALRTREERLQVENAIHESEARFRSLFHNLSDLVFLYEINEAGMPGRFIEVNPTACQVLGYQREDFLGMSRMDVAPPDEVFELSQLWARNHLSKQFTHEGNLLTREGAAIPVEINARMIPWQGSQAVLAVARDITERKRIEKALKQSAERLLNLHEIDKSILIAQSSEELANGAMVRLRSMIDVERTSIAVFDRSVEESLIFSSNASGGETIFKSGLHRSMDNQWVDQLKVGKTIVYGDLSQVRPLSPLLNSLYEEGILSFACIPLINQNELIGLLNLSSTHRNAFLPESLEIAKEVADQISIALRQAQLYEQISQYAAVLEQRVAERTAELEYRNRELQTFAYSVSHDLKAPLRGIDGYSHLLLEYHSGQLDDEGRDFLNKVCRSTVQMSQLIDDLLSYSRLERHAMVRSSVHLMGFVESIIAEREGEIHTRGVQLKVDLNCGTVNAEPEGLALAIRNLLDNALKFTNKAEIPSIEICGYETPSACILSVKDNGIGFDMQYQDRIFEIFQRLQRIEDYPGTGVGLAIVRLAMQRMGGRVWAESEPGHGATFFLEIPK